MVVLLWPSIPGPPRHDCRRFRIHSAANRNNWKLTKFAHENNLGDAVGLNFYLAEWDDYVPKLYAGFKG